MIDQHTPSEYLWERAGQADADIVALEAALLPARYVPRPLVLPDSADAASEDPSFNLGASRTTPVFRSRPGFAAAAGVMMAGLAVLLARPAAVSGPPWEVDVLRGRPRVQTRAITTDGRLARGQWLVTDAASSAKLSVGNLGSITVHPRSRVRIAEDSPGRTLLDLPRGTIHAYITAPPEIFYVDTPSALAIDLGCEYTLSVDDAGGSRLEVLTGIVRLEGAGVFANVPQGHRCTTRARSGPGLPLALDASEDLCSAAEAYDLGLAASVDPVLSESRREDGVTLWHLLQRTEGAARVRVYERLVALHPLPEGVSRGGVLRLDNVELDLYWDWLLFTP